jgi:hypothetical protein
VNRNREFVGRTGLSRRFLLLVASVNHSKRKCAPTESVTTMPNSSPNSVFIAANARDLHRIR